MYLPSYNIFPLISASQRGRKVPAADRRQQKFVSLATKQIHAQETKAYVCDVSGDTRKEFVFLNHSGKLV